MSKAVDHVIIDLMEGNQRFLSGNSKKSPNSSLEKLKDLADKGQSPKAIILCCSDSRAPVETLFDQEIGDLFVIRVAGNIIAPSLVGSVEFAARAFGTKCVLVMGHTLCGAIKATLDHIHTADLMPSENIQDIVLRIKSHIFSVTQIADLSSKEQWDLAAEANVLASVKQLSCASPLIEDLILHNKIRIFGAILDLSTGLVRLL